MRPVEVKRTVLLSPGHAHGEEGEPDATAQRRLAEEKERRRQVGSADSPVVAAEADNPPVGRLPGLARLLQQVVVFTR